MKKIEIKQIEINKVKKCTCNEKEYPKHTCPFKTDIEDDYKTLCNCCPYCEEQCFCET